MNVVGSSLCAGRRHERELVGEELVLRRCVPPAGTARQVREAELRQLLAELRLDVGELEIGNDLARLAARELEPDAHRPLAARDRRRQRKPFAPRGDVGVVEPYIQAALRVLPRPRHGAADLAAQIERRGQLRRRRPFETETMVAELAFQPELDAIQHELRRVAQIVVPGDECVANHDLALAQDPVGHPRIVGRAVGIDFNAGNVEQPGPIAADRQPWAVDRELFQAQLEERQRRPRDDQIDFRQLEQRHVAVAVADAKSLDDDLRVPAVPAGRQRGNFHGLTELPGQRFGHRVAVGVDAREHDEAHDEERQRKKPEARHDDNAGNAGKAAEHTAKRCSGAGGGARGRHNRPALTHCSGYPAGRRVREPRANARRSSAENRLVPPTSTEALRQRSRGRARLQPLRDASPRRSPGRARAARRHPRCALCVGIGARRALPRDRCRRSRPPRRDAARAASTRLSPHARP